MREIALIHEALFNKFFDRNKVNPLSVGELQTIASHYSKSEFTEEYNKYLVHTFKGSIMNKVCLEMALINNRAVFLPEESNDTRGKSKKQVKKAI